MYSYVRIFKNKKHYQHFLNFILLETHDINEIENAHYFEELYIFERFFSFYAVIHIFVYKSLLIENMNN